MATSASLLLTEASDLAEHESVRLLLTAAKKDRGWLVGDPPIDEPTVRRFRKLVARRRNGEPLQYIEGLAGFGPIEVIVDRRALIPRPETERLWELAVEVLGDIAAPNIVDLCTGTGNLALALKHRYPDARVVGVDVSQGAVALANENACRLGLDVEFQHGDLFVALPEDIRGGVDLIVSNPPYVTEDEYRQLPKEIVDHEPRLALVAGNDGLDVLARIAEGTSAWLRVGGAVVCEIGETQGDACLDLFADFGPEILQDLTGRDRFVVGCAPMALDVH